jgi:hypothetical protein
LFLICAVVGGALVLAQLLLSMLAFGAGHGLRLHHKIGGSPKLGATVAGHRGGMSRGGHQARAGIRTNAATGTRPTGGVGKIGVKPGASGHSSAVVVHAAGHWTGHWARAWVLGMLNFQGIVSGITVFGLVGLASNAAKQPGSESLKLAVAAAVVMMALVSGMLSMMTGLERDGTVDLHQAVGKQASVYLSVPAKNSGQGKVTVSLQQRLMEFPAVTFQDDLLVTGQNVVIVAVLETGIMLVVSADKYAEEFSA